jgi:hypothetical protein
LIAFRLRKELRILRVFGAANHHRSSRNRRASARFPVLEARMKSGSKGLAICAGIAVLGGGLAGIGLAGFTRTDAFEFYKQAPSRAPRTVAAEPANPGSAAPAAPAWPENSWPAQIAPAVQTAEPAEDRQDQPIEPDLPVLEEAVAAPQPLFDPGPEAEPEPVIPPRRGSWSAPEEEATPPDPGPPADGPTS